ncbi:hypothetical protein [Campylobacter sp.]|uniref:hypothetical protein n=1 Tax=Campylobacter sp. TaxID=205 RepID=UPI002A58EA9E|nr:hypothetical protein [Campylobacter sp.]MDD7090678.1 hypothetical protein [Campylobacteraceae bacterium]MDY3246249.1 hypothetical protein [Campylobacter sp.]MDY5285675.1 hypothetical protein [Campylobacter sp.]
MINLRDVVAQGIEQNIDSAFQNAKFAKKINLNQSLDGKLKEFTQVEKGAKSLEVRLENGTILAPSKELSDDERLMSQQNQIEYIQNIINGLDTSNIISAIQYSSYDAILGLSNKNTITKQMSKMSQSEIKSLIGFIEKNPVSLITPYGESELAKLFLDDISIDEFKDKWAEFSKKTMEYKNSHPDEYKGYEYSGMEIDFNSAPTISTNSQNNELDKMTEIERNNRMLLRQYNGAKSRNLSLESKNEILKTFFEEFLKNNNPLALLEIMKKTDIRA